MDTLRETLERGQRSTQQGHQGQSQHGHERLRTLGSISDPVAYPNPVEARYRGRNVTVSILANVEGMSPAKEVTYADGTSDWVSIFDPDLRITDTRVKPPSAEQQFSDQPSLGTAQQRFGG